MTIKREILMKKRFLTAVLLFCILAVAVSAQEKIPGMVLIPAGSFEMGDHHGFVDPKHGGDEIPVHNVRLDSFYIGINDVTTKEYCDFLNSALAQKQIAVKQGGVYFVNGNDLLCETREMSPYSRIGWTDGRFTVLDRKENHPIICIRCPGAAAYCNWLSAQKGLPLCYNTSTWDCDFNKSGYRLPTEAEWEYAARGGQQKPYWNFPWANEADPAKANWPESKNPYRSGPEPWTTPVGFFDGKLHNKSDYGWPGTQETFQTANGANGYGLYDMAGNVWQFVNDWYVRDYYSYSPTENPPGPERGSLMPDGKAYRGMRGGNWFNGENGHSRVSNRNPSYWRGPKDPDHPYYHIGFRVALPVNAESRPVLKPTPVQKVERGEATPRAQAAKDSSRPARQETPQTVSNSPFVLRSSQVSEGGNLPEEFTGDGSGVTLPLEWSGAPSGTKSYALIMHHIDPKGVAKWYWILYNIPADVQSLSKNVKGVGTLGNNSVNERTEYAPPHSKGPGAKTYIYTVYALSAVPQLSVSPDKVNREVLLEAMKDKILASAELRVVYSRPEGSMEKADEVRPGPPPPRDRPNDSDSNPKTNKLPNNKEPQ
jgi:Raf kinase inhibitor-like YbhB/YbcL family protein